MQHELAMARAPIAGYAGAYKKEGAGFQAQSFASLLRVPIIGVIIAIILFGPIVLTSFIKFLPGIPLNVWIVGIVILFVWKWLFR